jgi:hypothetical protein
MVSGTLASPQGQADEPDNQEDDGHDPQKMQSEAQSSEQQNQKKRDQDNHDPTFRLLMLSGSYPSQLRANERNP